MALLIDYASQFLDTLRADPARMDAFFIRLDRAVRDGAPGQAPPVFWRIDRPGDLPAWFALGNAAVRDIRIPLPDQEDRLHFAETVLPLLRGPSDNVGGGEQKALEQFALLAEGMSFAAMERVAILAQREGIALGDIADAIRIYRIGSPGNPWRSRLMRSRIAEGEAIVTRRVKGQAVAVRKTLDILVRSYMGLSGAQTSSGKTRPRGVLFFAGPSGVGKTELAKAVTELCFGDETAYHRYDMSEFMAETAAARLIGAPPDAYGHAGGGELVNAVRTRPFSVFLFDEIEKAHPRVLDIFLQILDEGRLTDSRGDTAYFSESLLIFTSNIGVTGGETTTNMGFRVLPSDSHVDLERKIIKGITEFFQTNLQRPELMNRLGQNVIVFDFITARSATLIFDALLHRVLDAVWTEHRIEVTLQPEAYDALLMRCTLDLFNGGRGIGNQIEEQFVNPLARLLFATMPKGTLTIAGVEDRGGAITLIPA